MKPHTRELHESLLRLAKGMVTAWERWLVKEVAEPDKAATIEDVMRILKESAASNTRN